MQDLGKPKWTLPKTEYKKLSQSVAKKALPSYKTRWIRDTQIPGFALRIEKTGSKSWTFGYKHKPSGKPRLHTIGQFNGDDGDDAKNARHITEDLKRGLRDGKYPTNFSEARTVKEIVEDYLKNKKRLKNNTGSHYWMERIVIPYVGDMTLDELTNPIIWNLRDNKIAPKEGSNAAEFFVVYLKAAWNHALKYGNTQVPNPCSLIDGITKREDKNALEEKEYPAFWRALEKLTAENCNPFVAMALEMLALTGNRRGEIASIEVANIGLENREIVIPFHKNNTNGEGKPLYIPYDEDSPIEALVEKALSLREELEISLEDNGYLFPSMDQYGNVRKNNTIYRGMDWQWKKIKKFEPTLAEHRLKDLRSGWVTFGVRTLKYDKDTIAKANGRADVGTMDRHYLAAPKTRDAFNNVAAGISQLKEAI